MTDRAIVKDKGICGGKARIAGTRITVVDIIERLWAGDSETTIADEYGLTTAQIEAAREYVSDNYEEIEADHRQRVETYERLLRESRARRPAE